MCACKRSSPHPSRELYDPLFSRSACLQGLLILNFYALFDGGMGNRVDFGFAMPGGVSIGGY
jgi:hypothetical protein